MTATAGRGTTVRRATGASIAPERLNPENRLLSMQPTGSFAR